MPALNTEEMRRANEVWERYQRTHDLSGQAGWTAGIDPATERVYIGASIPDVVQRIRSVGVVRPLLFKRIGADTYYFKGGRRC